MFLRVTLLTLALASPLPAQGAFLGVSVEEPDGAEGVLVAEVVTRSAAAVCGIQSGDRILSLGGLDTETPAALVAAVAAHRPGEVVDVVLARAGESLGILVVLGRQPRLHGLAEPDRGLRRMPGFGDRLAPPMEWPELRFDGQGLGIPELPSFDGRFALPDLDGFFDWEGVPGRPGFRWGLGAPGWVGPLTVPDGWDAERQVRIRYPASTPAEEREKLLDAVRKEYGPDVQVEFEGEGTSIEIRQGFTGAGAPRLRDRTAAEEYDA